MAKKRVAKASRESPLGDLLRAAPGPVDLARIDTRATPGIKGGKAAAEALRPALAECLSVLQGQLYASGRTGGTRSALLVLQGMDTSGKSGSIKRIVAHVNPAGVRIASFGRPTRAELRHDFLWRIRRSLPHAGELGVFDRSHYEDVVATRVRGTVDRRTWTRRYDSINRFEGQLVSRGTTVVKCFLHISREEQRLRLLARLDNPAKIWKFNPADLDDRERWDDFMTAYGDAIERCSTSAAPWHIVPADRKWYRDWAVTRLLVEQLDGMGLAWPEPLFDVDEMGARLRA